MARTKYFKRRRLTLAQQIYFMRLAFPLFTAQRFTNVVEWIGLVTPGDLSDTYRVKVRYKIPDRPEVTVLSPVLRLAKGKKRLPHVFPPDWTKLCLYVNGEWSPDKPVAWIIPWIAFWLYFYEAWLITGKWFGEGHEPAGKDLTNVPNPQY